MSPDPRTRRSPSLADRLGRLRQTPGTAAIVVVCVAAFAFTAWKGDTNDAGHVLRFGATERSHVWRGEYWRLGTAMFLHGGWLHLGLNMYFGSTWNAAVERLLGTARFLLLYLLAGVFASATSVLIHDAVSVGASGAMFGMIGAIVALMYRRNGNFQRFSRDPAVRSLLFNIALWLAIGFSTDFIDNWAHLGGFAYGAALGYVLTDFVRPSDDGPPIARDRAAHGIHWAMALTVLAFTAAAACRRWPRQRAEWGAIEACDAARAALRDGDAARAAHEADVAIDYDDAIPAPFAMRGLVRASRGDLDGAIEDLERALRMNDPRWQGAEATRKLVDELRDARASASSSAAPTAPAPSTSAAPRASE